jgi:hypothetical protein
LSNDDSVEREKLRAATDFATRLARAHEAQLDHSLGLTRVVAEELGEAHRRLASVLWEAYLGHLVGHLSSVLGKDATTGILTQVLAAHTGDACDSSH